MGGAEGECVGFTGWVAGWVRLRVSGCLRWVGGAKGEWVGLETTGLRWVGGA